MPAAIIIARGLVHPPPWCGRRFPAVGLGVNSQFFLILHVFSLKTFLYPIFNFKFLKCCLASLTPHPQADRGGGGP